MSGTLEIFDMIAIALRSQLHSTYKSKPAVSSAVTTSSIKYLQRGLFCRGMCGPSAGEDERTVAFSERQLGGP